jgi:hypothetical protein
MLSFAPMPRAMGEVAPAASPSAGPPAPALPAAQREPALVDCARPHVDFAEGLADNLAPLLAARLQAIIALGGGDFHSAGLQAPAARVEQCRSTDADAMAARLDAVERKLTALLLSADRRSDAAPEEEDRGAVAAAGPCGGHASADASGLGLDSMLGSPTAHHAIGNAATAAPANEMVGDRAPPSYDGLLSKLQAMMGEAVARGAAQAAAEGAASADAGSACQAAAAEAARAAHGAAELAGCVAERLSRLEAASAAFPTLGDLHTLVEGALARQAATHEQLHLAALSEAQATLRQGVNTEARSVRAAIATALEAASATGEATLATFNAAAAAQAHAHAEAQAAAAAVAAASAAAVQDQLGATVAVAMAPLAQAVATALAAGTEAGRADTAALANLTARLDGLTAQVSALAAATANSAHAKPRVTEQATQWSPRASGMVGIGPSTHRGPSGHPVAGASFPPDEAACGDDVPMPLPLPAPRSWANAGAGGRSHSRGAGAGATPGAAVSASIMTRVESGGSLSSAASGYSWARPETTTGDRGGHPGNFPGQPTGHAAALGSGPGPTSGAASPEHSPFRYAGSPAVLDVWPHRAAAGIRQSASGPSAVSHSHDSAPSAAIHGPHTPGQLGPSIRQAGRGSGALSPAFAAALARTPSIAAMLASTASGDASPPQVVTARSDRARLQAPAATSTAAAAPARAV